MNRKQFLKQSGVVIGASLIGCKSASQVIKATPHCGFDMHTHPGAFFRKGSDSYLGDMAFVNRVQDMKAHGIHSAFFSIVSDLSLLQVTPNGIEVNGTFEKGEGWKHYRNQLDVLKELFVKADVKIGLQSEDHDCQNDVVGYISCEGGDFLDDDISNLEKAYIDGVRSIQLVHYAPNSLGDLQTWKAVHGGLSAFGKEVVSHMNRLGMVIDVAHASARTVKNVVDITDSPIILSHSILKKEDDRPIGARAISEGHAKMIADTGGVIGMWPSGFSNSLDEFVDATLEMVDTIGINHVGIGTDMDANYKPVISQYSEYQNWKEALASKGMNNEEVSKVIGGNMRRVLNEVIS